VPHDSVLKDHALSYLLAGIAGVPELRARLVFKGGTALRKCYFGDYRYSEDLDFSTRDLHSWSNDEFLALVRDACGIVEDLTSSFGAYSFTPRVASHRAEHPLDQLDLRVDVSYPTGAQHSLKIEVTQQEPIVRPVLDLPILHAFDGEEFEATLSVYGLDEIVLEKLRAFLQVRALVQSRPWTTRARDLFDLYILHHDHRDKVRWEDLLEPLHVKAAARGVTFTEPDDFRAPEVLDMYRRQWTGRLENFVPGDLPDFDDADAELREILAAVFGSNADASLA
jgi:predicted nucleotidyltransferase component of viral defense system